MLTILFAYVAVSSWDFWAVEALSAYQYRAGWQNNVPKQVHLLPKQTGYKNNVLFDLLIGLFDVLFFFAETK